MMISFEQNSVQFIYLLSSELGQVRCELILPIIRRLIWQNFEPSLAKFYSTWKISIIFKFSGLFFVYFRLFQTHLQNKNCRLSRIRTRIVGKHADHLTITSPQKFSLLHLNTERLRKIINPSSHIVPKSKILAGFFSKQYQTRVLEWTFQASTFVLIAL